MEERYVRIGDELKVVTNGNISTIAFTCLSDGKRDKWFSVICHTANGDVPGWSDGEQGWYTSNGKDPHFTTDYSYLTGNFALISGSCDRQNFSVVETENDNKQKNYSVICETAGHSWIPGAVLPGKESAVFTTQDRVCTTPNFYWLCPIGKGVDVFVTRSHHCPLKWTNCLDSPCTLCCNQRSCWSCEVHKFHLCQRCVNKSSHPHFSNHATSDEIIFDFDQHDVDEMNEIFKYAQEYFSYSPATLERVRRIEPKDLRHSHPLMECTEKQVHNCHACKYLVEGHFYKCERQNCSFYLHPLCVEPQPDGFFDLKQTFDDVCYFAKLNGYTDEEIALAREGYKLDGCTHSKDQCLIQ
eukprot:TRINITY_DN3203_c0_g1_i17.p1 TRINITY_DN3203_c0_g1~~TRINITY_DN3203_c0_g1_i17.p1  ORF type:complete len:355 (+),score=48.86 TRINITY_DN3203_c0_g1_i17:2592-3656(+)